MIQNFCSRNIYYIFNIWIVKYSFPLETWLIFAFVLFAFEKHYLWELFKYYISNILFSDFISLELERGQPRLLIDFGSGTLELKVKTKKSLDDGEWHRIDIFWDTEVCWVDWNLFLILFLIFESMFSFKFYSNMFTVVSHEYRVGYVSVCYLPEYFNFSFYKVATKIYNFSCSIVIKK